jgi:hypothetical protein
LRISAARKARDVVVEAAQQPCAAHDLRHVRAQASKNRRHLAGDVAAADHRQALGKARQVEHLVRTHGMLGARHLRQQRVAAGGHQDVPGLPPGPVDVDLVRRHDAGASTHERGAGAFEHRFVDAVQTCDLRRAIALEQRPVEARRAGGPAEAARFFEGFTEMGRIAVELLGNAAQVHTGAAERAGLRDGDFRTALGRQARRAHAAAAGADDEQVEFAV